MSRVSKVLMGTSAFVPKVFTASRTIDNQDCSNIVVKASVQESQKNVLCSFLVKAAVFFVSVYKYVFFYPYEMGFSIK